MLLAGDVVPPSAVAQLLCVVARTAAQNAAHAASTAIDFTAADPYDPLGMHDPAGLNPSQITLPVTGWYQCFGRLGWASNAAGNRSTVLRLNAVAVAEIKLPSAGAEEMALPIPSDVFFANAGGILQLFGRQTTGIALDTGTTSQFTPRMAVVYLGPN